MIRGRFCSKSILTPHSTLLTPRYRRARNTLHHLHKALLALALWEGKMILPGKLLNLLFLLRKEVGYIWCTFYMIVFSVWSNKGIMFYGTKSTHRVLFPNHSFLTIIKFPHTMIKTNAISLSITEQRRISQAVLRIMHKPMTIHLKPVNIFLIRHTKHI